MKDTGWWLGRYHRILQNAVVSGGDEKVSIRRLCVIKL